MQLRNVDAVFARVFAAVATSTIIMPQTFRARVFVTLKPSVFDPQGRTIADALHSMGYGSVGDVRQGKYFELDVTPTRTTPRVRWSTRGLAQAARQPGDRELSGGDGASAEAIMKFAVVVFPGSNCDHDAYHAAKHVLGEEAEFRLAQGHRRSAAPTR